MKYTTAGKIVENNEDVEGFHIIKLNNDFYFDGDSIFYDLDYECVDLYKKFTELVFGSLDEYYNKTGASPLWHSKGGVDSDSRIDSAWFNKTLQENGNELIYKEIFLADCHALISCLQNRILASRDIFIQFYIYFCELKIDHFMDENGIFWTTGGKTNLIFGILNDIFSTNYAILDLVTKIAFQFENMPNDYSKYPKLKCSNIVYGDKAKIKKIDKTNTVFEEKKEIKMIISLRHELIHNATWEPLPKIFYEVENSEIINKYIYQPDINPNGTIIKVKNRKRFYSQEMKINETLPEICFPFWRALLETVKKYEETIIWHNKALPLGDRCQASP